MATPTIGAKFKVDGEKEFKDAISNINSGLGVLNSEMKKTKAQFQDNADSVEALTAKNDILERKLYTQKDKVEECRKALEYLASQGYGEADEAMMKWQKSLNEAEKDVYNTEAAIRKNNEALESVSGSAEVAKTGISNFVKVSVAGFATVAAAITAVIETEKKLINMTKESASNADNILTLSQITGLDTDTIQELQYASELIDVSFETIQSSMAKLVRNMSSAQKGTGDAADAFKALGVSITDSNGELRNNNDVFNDVIDKLGELENETQRDAYAMAIFGKSAQDLNPLIVQGSQVLKGYRDEAEDLDYVLTEEELAALGAVDDAFQRLTNTQDGIKNKISAELAPSVEGLVKACTEGMRDIKEALDKSGVIDFIGTTLEIFTQLTPLITTLIEVALPNLGRSFENIEAKVERFNTKLMAVLDAFVSLGNLLSPIMWFSGEGIISTEYSDTYKANRKYATTYNVGEMYAQYGENWQDYVGGNASGDYNFQGGLTWVGENGAELVNLPYGSQIYSNQESRKMSGDTYNITIDAKSVREFNDIVTIVKNSRVNARMRG